MKQFIVVIILALALIGNAGAQWSQPHTILTDDPDWTSPVREYRYILVYREWIRPNNMNFIYRGANAVPAPSHFENRLIGFDSMADMLNWLSQPASNIVHWDDIEQKHARFDDGAIVAIYDIDRMERIKLKFHTKERTREAKREVVVEEKKWTDQWWEEK